jgi:Leucine carboxyl methyltransferase
VATDPLITHVSDTARWVATYRAVESARPDALFHDALADRLAGQRGRAIVAAAPRMIRNGCWLVARTKVIDDVIIEAIGDGCDKVLNLAAGLDARPYRLDLPPDFTWVEADLPQLLAEKEQALADETPRCQLTRHAVDLADPAARDAFLNEELARTSKALILTEGLLMYLEERRGGIVGGIQAARGRLVDARFRRPGTAEADEQEDPRPDAECAVQVRACQRPGLLRRPRLAGRRSGIGVHCGAPIRSAAAVDAISGVATPAGSAQSGRQDLERRRPAQPSLTTSAR